MVVKDTHRQCQPNSVKCNNNNVDYYFDDDGDGGDFNEWARGCMRFQILTRSEQCHGKKKLKIQNKMEKKLSTLRNNIYYTKHKCEIFSLRIFFIQLFR